MFGNLEELKNRIDRAVEYIEDNCIYQQFENEKVCSCSSCVYVMEMRNILSILKGTSH